MNSDEIKNLIPFAVAALGPILQNAGISPNDLSSWLSLSVGLAIAIFQHWNLKKVPETAIVVSK